ncbi:tyrosine-type recombinase/integrase [Psychrobacillus sp. NPDC096426]|uniref:tyrosine-type recombinase/integrase n=1 Tax=Psychrobacillus sp. NPDC096426 TaxID=3364491 RepID=UPI0038018D4B
MSRESMVHWFAAYRKELDFYLSPHTLRNTFAAHLAMKGIPFVFLKVLLGRHHVSQTDLYAGLHH